MRDQKNLGESESGVYSESVHHDYWDGNHCPRRQSHCSVHALLTSFVGVDRVVRHPTSSSRLRHHIIFIIVIVVVIIIIVVIILMSRTAICSAPRALSHSVTQQSESPYATNVVVLRRPMFMITTVSTVISEMLVMTDLVDDDANHINDTGDVEGHRPPLHRIVDRTAQSSTLSSSTRLSSSS